MSNGGLRGRLPFEKIPPEESKMAKVTWMSQEVRINDDQ